MSAATVAASIIVIAIVVVLVLGWGEDPTDFGVSTLPREDESGDAT